MTNNKLFQITYLEWFNWTQFSSITLTIRNIIMKQITDYEFGKDFNVYVKIGTEYSCYSFDYYTDNKKEFTGKDLIIAHKNVPVYFRQVK
jgi:hypothetical protein